MNRGSSFFVRLVTFLVGAILAAVGVILILWHVGVEPIADALHNHWPSAQIKGAPDTNWWLGALFGVAIVGILLAIINISVLARRRTVDTLFLDKDNPEGRISMEIGDIAKAIASDTENHDLVRDASAHAINDNGVTCIDVNIDAAAEAPIADLLQVCEQVAVDVPAAVAYTGATSRVFLNFDKPRAEGQKSGVVAPQNLTPVEASANELAHSTDTTVEQS